MPRTRTPQGALKRAQVSLLAMLSVAGLAGLSAPGCGDDDKAAAGPVCLSNRDYFEQVAWKEVLQPTCLQCHALGGPGSQGSDFVLMPSSYPGFMDANVKLISEKLVPQKYNGSPVLVAKPTGATGDHGGGKRFEPGSAEANILSEMVSRFSSGKESCGDQDGVLPADVQLETYSHTFRRASLLLGARMPTAAEEQSLAKDDEKAFDAAMDNLLKEQAFLDWLKLAYNDIFLTDSFMQYDGRALDVLNGDLYPGKAAFDYEGPKQEQRPMANRAIAREPLELIAYIVKNDMPFTKILNADFTVVNPYSAEVYGVKPAFKNKADENEFVEAKVTLKYEDGSTYPLPHSGILSTSSFLNRWTTTPTNRSRGRARVVFKTLLATDILKIAERPVDATKVAKVDNPTRNQAECKVCHELIDPVAGAFRGWSEGGDYEFWSLKDAQENWHVEMKPPGFADVQMPGDDYPTALRWLGDSIADDPRFAIATVQTMYKALTGHDAIVYPVDTEAENFKQAFTAWQTQDAFLRSVADEFIKDGYNIKTVVKLLVKSPYYRAVDAPDSIAAGDASVNGLGTGHWLGPEMINRKIFATTGVNWTENYGYDQPSGPPKWFDREDVRILYGGIDSDSVITRVAIPNGVMSNIGFRMANEVSCNAVPFDLSKSQAKRFLFSKITDMTDISEANVKANIVYLFERLLGETKTADDADVQAVYDLFTEARNEGTISGAATQGLQYPCNLDPTTGKDLPEAIRQDAGFVVRAWQAVLVFFLTDYRFLYD